MDLFVNFGIITQSSCFVCFNIAFLMFVHRYFLTGLTMEALVYKVKSDEPIISRSNVQACAKLLLFFNIVIPIVLTVALYC